MSSFSCFRWSQTFVKDLILVFVFVTLFVNVVWSVAYFPRCESQLISSQFVEDAISGLIPPNPNDRLIWISGEGLNVPELNYTTKSDTGFQYFAFFVSNRSAERWIVVSFNISEAVVDAIYLSAGDCPVPQCEIETNILADPHDCGFGARDQYTPPTDTSQNIQQLRVAIKKSSGVFFLGVQQYNSTGTFQLQIFPTQPSSASIHLSLLVSLICIACLMLFNEF